MTQCPECKHIYKDPGKVKGGQASKRTDMGKGSEGQMRAQAGKKLKQGGEMEAVDRNKRWVPMTNYCKRHGSPWCVECEKADNEEEKLKQGGNDEGSV